MVTERIHAICQKKNKETVHKNKETEPAQPFPMNICQSVTKMYEKPKVSIQIIKNAK